MIDIFLLKILGLVIATYLILFALVTVHMDVIRNGEKYENKVWAVFAHMFIFGMLGYFWYVLLMV